MVLPGVQVEDHWQTPAPQGLPLAAPPVALLPAAPLSTDLEEGHLPLPLRPPSPPLHYDRLALPASREEDYRPLSIRPLPLHCENLVLPASREEDYRPLSIRPLPLHCENSGSASPEEEDRPVSLQPLPLHCENLALPAYREEDSRPRPTSIRPLPLHCGNSGSASPEEEDRPLSLQPLPLHCQHLALPASREEDYRPLSIRPLLLRCENSGSVSPEEEGRSVSLQPLPLHGENLALPAPREEEHQPLSIRPLRLHCEHSALPASRSPASEGEYPPPTLAASLPLPGSLADVAPADPFQVPGPASASGQIPEESEVIQLPARTANLFLDDPDRVELDNEVGGEDEPEDSDTDANQPELPVALLEHALPDNVSEDTPQFDYCEPHQPSNIQDLLDLGWNNLVVRHNLSQQSAREVKRFFGAVGGKKPCDYRTARKRIDAITGAYSIWRDGCTGSGCQC